MNTKQRFEIRGAAERHGGRILKLMNDAFPFERAPSGVDPLTEIKRIIREGKNDHIALAVGIQKRDELCGFSIVRPHVAGNGRRSKAVCYMPEVVVNPNNRKAGLGKQLVGRALEMASQFGYTNAFASIPSSLEDWYKGQGWTVAEKGNVYAWVEAPHPGDDKLWPGDPLPREYRGMFTPLQSQQPGPVEHGYDRIAYKTITENSTFFGFDHPGSPADSARQMFQMTLKDPYLLAKFPLMTAVGIANEMQFTGGARIDEIVQYRTVLGFIGQSTQ